MKTIRKFIEHLSNFHYLFWRHLNDIPYLTDPAALLEGHAFAGSVGYLDAVLDSDHAWVKPVAVLPPGTDRYNLTVMELCHAEFQALTWLQSACLLNSAHLIVRACPCVIVCCVSPSFIIEFNQFLLGDCVDSIVKFTRLAHQQVGPETSDDHSVS